MIEAVIETGGKQYKVAKGAKLAIGNIEGKAGDTVSFDKVLLVAGEPLKIGTPYVSGAKVTGRIVSQEKSGKIIVFTYKRRKGYHKKRGHRQLITRVEIQDIQA